MLSMKYNDPPITRNITCRTIVHHLMITTGSMMMSMMMMVMMVLPSTVRLGKGVGPTVRVDYET